ncbi:iron-containing redox enzyme family protein [Streptomyces sp. R302]|uniref:iron-containing redox enzyme family protein n=1 Tax=unclassified Streptomyces TaxID=2593676 RepID=UPI00145F46BB|nr:iron-containing redox enzyme family protein [Streptomyces sp. R301]NML81146.1 iron-containing redox enzyme family protein [Streptomyces sp. R302]
MLPPSASDRLRARLAVAEPALRAAAGGLWRPEGIRERYPAYLGAMHTVIRASVPLLRRAAGRARVLAAEGDPLGGPLADHLEHHAREEEGHDAWLLQDLAAAGEDPGAVLGSVPPPDAAALAGAQYYWIEHHHPVALLGYVTVLEGHAPEPDLVPYLAARTGLPAAAFRTVRAHARLDTGHVAEVYALLDALPLGRAHESAVTVSALHTLDALTRLFVRLGRPAPAVAPGRETGRSAPTRGLP